MRARNKIYYKIQAHTITFTCVSLISFLEYEHMLKINPPFDHRIALPLIYLRRLIMPSVLPRGESSIGPRLPVRVSHFHPSGSQDTGGLGQAGSGTAEGVDLARKYVQKNREVVRQFIQRLCVLLISHPPKT